MATSQPMKVSILIGADASGAKAGGAVAEQALDEVAKSADEASASINKLVGESNKLDAALGEVGGKSDLPAYGAQLEALRAKYNPLFATVQRYRNELQGIRDAHRLGAISSNEMAAAISRERQATLASIDAIKGRNTAIRTMQAANSNVASFQTANIAAQFQDIAVTSAMGMSPLQIALQQGTQLSMALGTSGAAGSVRALGAAFMSLVSPVSLITLGFVAAAAAAIQYFTSSEDGAEKAQKLLDAQNETIRKAAQLWGDAAPAFKAYVAELDRVDKLKAGQEAVEVLGAKEFEGQAENLRNLSNDVQRARDELARLGADDQLVQDLGGAFSNLWKNLDAGKASIGDVLEVKRELGLAMKIDSDETKRLAGNFDKLTASMLASATARAKVQAEFIRSIAGGTDVQDIVSRNTFLDNNGTTQYTNTFTPKNPPIPTARPNIELEGSDTAAGAKADIAAQVQARQSLMQTQREQFEQMRLESRLIGASTKERAVLTAALSAEQELRRQGISALSAEGQAYIANARAIAAARIETERLNQLSISRDPSGQRANIEEQVRARQSLWQSQKDEMAALTLEARLVGASTRERAVMTAGLQAEQTLRRQGISILSEEGRAYVENAKAMAATRVELERQNQLAVSRNPTGARSNIVDQVQARQQLVQAQNDEIEKLRVESQLVGASESVRSRALATLEAEQRLRQQGISALSQEGQAYIANAQAIAQARLELERQQAAYQAVQQAGSTMIDQLLVGTGSLKDRLKSMVETLLTSFQQLAFANPLKNQLFGTNLPTLGDLFSGKSATPIGATTTAAMTVTAGTVMINGVPLSGLNPLAANTNLPLAANTNVPLSSSVDAVNALRAPATNPALAGLLNDPSLANRMAADPATQASLYRQAISQIESGSYAGNYNAIGPLTSSGDRAYGRYQVMGNNVGPWTQQYYGQRLTPDQFLANQQAQDAVFDGEFGSYASKYGAGPAATKWFTGSHIATGRQDVNGMVDTRYQQQFENNLQKLSQSTTTASNNVNTLGTGALDTSKALTEGNGSLLNSITQVSQPAAPTIAAPAAPAAPSGGLFSGLFGAIGQGISGIGSVISKLFSGIFGMFFAEGGAFSGGNVIPFATGGVVNRPTLFPMSGGRRGVMGEAGPEAIMPLRRGPGGRLGVSMVMPRQVRQSRPDFRLNLSSTNTLYVQGVGDKELEERFQAANDAQHERSKAELRNELPRLLEDYRKNPWAVTYG